MRKYLILVLAIGICFAQNYVMNGDFERELTDGWSQSYSGSKIITRGTGFDEDPDYELWCEKFGGQSGYAKCYQDVDVPSTSIEFAIKAKIYAWDNHSSAWAGAGIILKYKNSSNQVLGETRICMRSTQCPWNNSSRCHIISVSDSMWHNYLFTLDEELANIPSVDPAEVAKVEVSAFNELYHC